MIDTLLKQDLPHAYGLQRANVQLTYWQETGIFELGDDVACKGCKPKFPDRNACNEKVIKVDATGTTITIVDHEEYIKQFNGKQIAKGQICDLLMYDDDNHKKVIFCDLGCYSDKYIEKKQMVSHKQAVDSMSRFLKQPCGQSFINQFAEKILMFGRRDPNINPVTTPTPIRGNVVGNMQSFIVTPFSKPKYAVSHEVVEGIDVSFIVVNYPEPYIW